MLNFTKKLSVALIVLLFSTVVNAQDISTLAGTGVAGNTGDGGPAAAATLTEPTSVAVDGSGNVFIASGNVIRKINSSGIISTIAGTGLAGYSGDGGPAIAARLNNPMGLALDPLGNLFFADRFNNRVRVVYTSGIIGTILGDGSYTTTGDGGLATAATCGWPADVAFDGAGNIYIADEGGERIRKINGSGIISTIAGSGTMGSGAFTGDGGPAALARFDAPVGVAVDGPGNVFISDYYNNRIRYINTSSIMNTYAGTGAGVYGGDGGPAAAAMLHNTWAVRTDAAGNLYIADQANNRIRMVNTSGVITTIAGDGTAGYSGDGGPATLARINQPTAAVTDAAGNIYIADFNNNVVRKITMCTAPMAAPITGSATVCQGANTTLSDATPGGVWLSTNTSVASISSAGVVTGVAGGTTTISYTVTDACGTATATFGMTVNPLPVVAPITGSSTVCPTESISLADATPGGAWSSSSASIATVDGTGNVTGVAAGIVNISYSVTNSCGTTSVIKNISVGGTSIVITIAGSSTAGYTGDGGPASAALLDQPGGMAIDAAGNIYFADDQHNVIRKIDVSGIITTIAGTGTLGYSGDGGMATDAMLSLPKDVAVDAVGNVYIADYFNKRIRKVTSAGIISTVAGNGGTGYGGDGGMATATSVYNPYGIAVDGAGNLFISDYGNQRIRKVNTSGVISTIAGTGTIGTLGDGGPATNARINNPHGLTVDAAGNVYFADYANHRIRKINTSGIISIFAGGLGSGYSGDGGPATAARVFNPTSVRLDGLGNVFIADYVNGRIRKVDPSGIITSISGTIGGSGYSGDGGPATLARFSGAIGCSIDASGNVFISDEGNNRIRKVFPGTAPVAAITGTAAVCTGSATLLNSTTAGGVWSSTTPGVATVDASGMVSGVAAGTATISYTVTTGCGTMAATTVVTVSNVPVAGTLTGIAVVCQGAIGGLSVTGGDAGGTWSSSIPSSATVNAVSGIFTGIAVGTTVISYTVTNSCSSATASATITVNPAPNAGTISGTATLCSAATTSVTSTGGAGGVWSSGSTSIATINSSTGVVTGVTTGTTLISYTVSNSCGTATATRVVTVNAIPNAGAITGTAVVCEGATTTLANATGDAGGAWTSVTTANATIGATTGIVSGITTGTSVISYTVTNSCGTAAATIIATVNPAPNAGTITGSPVVCVSATTNLTNAAPGGLWSSTATAVATVSGAGVVTGVASGTTTISYSVTNGCGTVAATRVVTVNTIPTAGTITGSTTVCPAGNITLSNATGTPGGIWTSGTPAVATINSSTGVVTGVAPGTTLISYTITNTCGTVAATTVVTVSLLPNAGTVTGTATVCSGATTLLSDAVSGGVWSSSTPARATVDAAGLVTGVSAGIATISYSVTNSCGTAVATRVITVNGLPSAGTITGATAVCQGLTITVSDAVPGGVWSSGTPAVATIGATGIVTGVASGTTTIWYAVTNGCGTNYATRVVSVNALPAPITGPGNLCLGGTVTLANASAGGTWSRSNGNITIGAASGIVTGITAGTTTVTYTIPTTCIITTVVTVNALPLTHAVTGGGSYCEAGSGVSVGMDNSQIGVDYQLYLGAATVGSPLSGTVAALSFGLITTAGIYTVMATDATTGCTRNMAGSATVAVIPNVAPAVTIAPSFSGPSTCNGTVVTFTASPVNGGVSPTYQWYVNGVMVGTATDNYTYTPVNGDVVSVTLFPGGICVAPASASGTYTVSVLPMAMPGLTISVSPGNPVCLGTLTTFTAHPVNGGSVPTFLWAQNGINVATGPSYSYVPTDGDIIVVTLTSNYLCRLADNAISSPVLVSVQAGLPAPVVTIVASPSNVIAAGTTVTLTATATGGTTTTAYQWFVNGTAIAGATSNLYTSNTFSTGDIITCQATNDDVCANRALGSVKIYVQGLGINEPVPSPAVISIYPDPNSGEFIIKGKFASNIDGTASVMITNTLGQVVYRSEVPTKNGAINTQVTLSNTLANSMYLIHLVAADEHSVLRFVLSR